MMSSTSSFKIAPLFQPIESELRETVDFLHHLLPPEVLPLADATQYSLGTLGKLVRPAMVHCLWNALTQKPSDERVIQLAAVTEMIHLATLLHDDVLDEADLRRDQATVRQKFGNRLAILGGDWLLAQASQTLARLGDLRLVSLYAQVLAELCEGEVLQDALAFQPLASITWEAYTQKTYKKTASLYVCAMHATALLAEANEAQIQQAIAFGTHFGMGFQFRDDLLDYTAETRMLGKPILDDIRNGLANAPILLAFQKREHQSVLWEKVSFVFHLVEQNAATEKLDEACLDLKHTLHACGGIEATEAVIRETQNEAMQTLACISSGISSGKGVDVLRQLLQQ